MIKLDYSNVSKQIIDDEGLDITQVFSEYAPKIQEIITNLNMNKDKPGSWLQWMNLGYNEETVWYVKEFAAMVDGRFDNLPRVQGYAVDCAALLDFFSYQAQLCIKINNAELFNSLISHRTAEIINHNIH